MGVIHKLKPEVRDYIITQKKIKPILSCREFVSLVDKKFKIKISKSSINTLIKKAGLSMPVGRRRKRRHRRVESEGLGAILLKSADCLFGGVLGITEIIKNRLRIEDKDLLTKTEAFLYSPLFNLSGSVSDKQKLGLEFLVDRKISERDISSYYTVLQTAPDLPQEISQAIPHILQEARCIKVMLNNTPFYFDGQFHTIWSTPYIPYDFSGTIYNTKSYIKKYFKEGATLVLFMAPGYNTPTKEFFDFILSQQDKEKKTVELTLYNNDIKELEIIKLEPAANLNFIFGMWPWQFTQYRKARIIGEFMPFYSYLLKDNFYVAPLELELLQPNVNKRVTLRGCALKKELNEKIRIIILSNLTPEKAKTEYLADMYLCRWPNLEEAFNDFNRKIELFTYTVNSHRFFSPKIIDKYTVQDIKALFDYYLEALHQYVCWHFLPPGYEEKGFSDINEQFYKLKARIKKQKNYFLVTFCPQPGYSFLSQLEYACRRLNERDIVFNGHKAWFSCGLYGA